jgi:hypothetical protein
VKDTRFDIKDATLVRRLAMLALLPLLLWSVWKWYVRPFVLQMGVRQELVFMCQQHFACKDIAAVKVFDRERGGMQRRVAVVIRRGQSAKMHELQVAATASVERAANEAFFAWKRNAILQTLPVVIRHD